MALTGRLQNQFSSFTKGQAPMEELADGAGQAEWCPSSRPAVVKEVKSRAGHRV